MDWHVGAGRDPDPSVSAVGSLVSVHHDAPPTVHRRMLAFVRTTINLDQDVLAEVERLRREHRLGLSVAVNTLARRGMAAQSESGSYEHISAPLGIKANVDNIGDVLELLDEAG